MTASSRRCALRGACFRPDRHLAALAHGARTLGIELPLPIVELADLADEAARRTEAPDAYVRVTLARGTDRPIVAIVARPLDEPPARDYDAGVDAVACGTKSNVFVVNGTRLVTPAVETGCRPGVTRGAVMELAARLGLTVRAERIAVDELVGAGEAFFASTRVLCLPIARVDGTTCAHAAGFPTTSRLRAALVELMKVATRSRRRR